MIEQRIPLKAKIEKGKIFTRNGCPEKSHPTAAEKTYTRRAFRLRRFCPFFSVCFFLSVPNR